MKPADQLDDRAPVSSRELGVYVHFPYCEHKCPYCDFNSHTLAFDDQAYGDAILAELEARGADFARDAPVRSIFFGGGTPSLWAPAQVGRVIAAIRDRYGLHPQVEITLEANPGTVHEARFFEYRAAGVNRFSIGVQSFIDKELAALERIHDAARAESAVRAALATGARVSLDLMYAFPGQGLAELEYSLSRALELGTDHLSAYTLTVEPDTALGRRARLGLFVPMDDDRQADMIEVVSARLEASGLYRYEVSNFAKPGHESRHNILYWVGGPYLGLGAGAHSYRPAPGLAGAERREAIKGPEDYLAGARRGEFSARFREERDRLGVLEDRLLVGLRTRWGLDPAALAEEAQLAGQLEPLLLPSFESLESLGLLRRQGGHFVPTARGFLFNDGIAKTLMRAVRALDMRAGPSLQSSQG